MSAAQTSTAEREVIWPNGSNDTVPRALRFLADNDRPQGGEQFPNSACLFQMADEIDAAVRRSDAFIKLARDILDAEREGHMFPKWMAEQARAALAAKTGGAQ